MGAVAKETKEPAKKGRGRPPAKEGGAEKKVYVPSGKPRGRPKGSGKKQKAAVARVAKAAGGKGRGRPKKAEEAADEAEEAAE